MPNNQVLVTGASGGAQGSTGVHVTRMLIDRGIAVRALVHRIDHRSEPLQRMGAEVVQGDLTDLADMRRALAGIKRAYFTYPVQEGLLQATAVFAAAAKNAGVERLVNLSQLRPAPEAPTPRMREHWISEQVFDWADLGAVHLRATVFFENLRALIGGSVAQSGKIFLPWGSLGTRFPLIAAEDVARVAASLLATNAFDNEHVVPLIGQIVSVGEMVAAVSAAHGRTIEYVQITDEDWRRAAAATGLNPHALEHLSQLWTFLRTSKETSTYDVTDTIQRIGGRRPTRIEEFLRAPDGSAGAGQIDAISSGA